MPGATSAVQSRSGVGLPRWDHSAAPDSRPSGAETIAKGLEAGDLVGQ